ncbi:MAG: UMP kinase [Spirochaetia bacterium]|jgi:uridylate kinase|nr:UMP kinase [Spirochaetia bacterium]
MTKVLSLGGSIVAPDVPDTTFVRAFAALARRWLDVDQERRLIIVVGGGGPARAWQKAYRDAVDVPDTEAQDWIGVMATRLNAQLVRSLFLDLCTHDVVTDPTSLSVFGGRVLVAAGWKPGFSTDFDAVVLAERFQADVVVNLSNIAKVYTADPRVDPDAKPIDAISWKDFRVLVGDEWSPGKNVPFDPIASRRAEELGLRVVCAAGKDLVNMEAILNDKPFIGTTIGG